MSNQTGVTAISIALLGNPNTGKSTLFNLLTGIHQHTGNYPGVTVEKRFGEVRHEGDTWQMIDLPGTYSLSPRAPDEEVAVRVLLGHQELDSHHTRISPDVILVVVDAGNLRRNLFLVGQLLELGLPTVVALNMTDLAASAGLEIHVEKLASTLGTPVIPIQANKAAGIDELKNAIGQQLKHKQTPAPLHTFDDQSEQCISELASFFDEQESSRRFLAIRALFDSNEQTGSFIPADVETRENFAGTLRSARERLATADCTLAELESRQRYAWIDEQLKQCVTSSKETGKNFSDRVDSVLTHPIIGLLIAAGVMLLLFQAVFYIADPGSQLIDWGKGLIAGWVENLIPEGALKSLIVNGVLEGVGGVIVFLPQILLLFLFLALLEDSGYLARAAFLMDKFLSRLGLNGSSLIPLLSSFACAIPGIMAARVIHDRRDRLITILVAPLMTCSARLPVYVLLIAAFVPKYQGLVMFGLYMLGIVTAIVVAWVLKKTILRGQSQSFVMELPSYKMPVWRNVGRKVFDGGWSFVRDAGTIIFAVTIVVWAAAYFPRSESSLDANLLAQRDALEQEIAEVESTKRDDLVIRLAELQDDQAQIENQIAAAHLENSFLGRGGKLIEPAVKPLGWDWRIGSAVIASFPAREVIVSTLGVIFGLGEGEDEESDSLRDSLKNATWEDSGKPLFTMPVALSIMVFFALCAQCVSTLAVMKRETNSWKWPIFTFVYMTGLAYIAAFLTFQIGKLILG